jgi:hypothetical protein
MKHALWILMLTVPLAAQQFDRDVTELPPGFAPAPFDAVYRQLLSAAPPSGLYAFELGPYRLFFEGPAQRYTVSFETVPVHDGSAALEAESLLLLVPTMDWVPSPRGFHRMDAWGIRLQRSVETRLSVGFPGPRELMDGKRLGYLAIVQIEPEDAPRLMESSEPEFREATGEGVHESHGERVAEHAVAARIVSIWAYDRTNGKVLGKRDP